MNKIKAGSKSRYKPTQDELWQIACIAVQMRDKIFPKVYQFINYHTVIPAYKENVDSSKLKKIPAAADGVYVYDVEIFTGTPEEVSRILEGRLYVDAQVTK